ncbi:TonB-dependent receptor [Tepidimonas taiwanensis]|nr:TonB-dependent siderophore receptor [Tepidimonas taiwanensis]
MTSPEHHAHPSALPPSPLRPTAVLPLGALLLAGSLQAIAQTAPTPANDTAGTLGTVTVTDQKEPVEIRSKSTLKPETTRLGKGEQSLRDIPQNVTVMTEQLLNDRNLDDFRDVLRTTAGVTFQAGETGEEDVRLRGFSLGQAGDIFRDGMREAQLITRDTFATERVEVLKGSASMLFGKGSTGGVVNQVTKQPFLMDRYEVEATIGNGNHRRVQADLNKQLGPSSAIRLNAMVQDADNWGAKDDRKGLAASWRTGIGERDEFQVDLYHLKTEQRPIYNHPWLLTGNTGDPKRMIVPVLPAKNFYGLASDYTNSEQTVLTLSHTHRFGPNEELRTTLRHGRYERDLWATVTSFCQNNATLCPGQTVSLANPPGPNTILSRNNFKGRRGISDITQLQSDYSNKFELGGMKHHLTAGIDITDEDARRNQNNGGGALPNTAPLSVRTTRVGTPNDGASRDDTRTWVYNTFNAKSVGVYAQDVVQIAPQWKLVGGLRFDRFEADYINRDTTTGNVIATGSRRDNLWSPRVGAIWEPDATSSYYVSYGQSYNTSGDTYQFALGNLAPGSSNAKVANTPPEKSRNIEIGGKWELFDKRALVGVALFRSEKYNERNTDPDSAATQALLSGKRHATGLEINAAGRITPKWEVFYNHTWIPSAKIDKCNAATCNPAGSAQREGDRPGLTPKHSLSAWTTYRIAPQWRVGLGFTHRGEQSPEGNRTVVAPSFTVWDGMIEYTVDEKTTVKLNVTNLTDKTYADALYRGFYAPGAPRRVYLSLKTVF